MAFLSSFKSTVFLWVLIGASCGNPTKGQKTNEEPTSSAQKAAPQAPIIVAANNTAAYLPLLEGKKIGIVANQTSVIFKYPKDVEESIKPYTHLVDSLLLHHITIKKVFAPEHGFRGRADAGEKVKDEVDAKTGLPLLSLHGKNRKPTAEQLQGLDLILFDIQDVGVRFYTYIATLQLVMEACAENNIPMIVLDRPNPNGHYIDGPTMEEAHTNFLGMTPIPLVYGMTIGEYAKMLNGEGWLANAKTVDLTVIPLKNYSHTRSYHLPIRPSPNLPNDIAINLYPSLGLFEGTTVNAGRGTEQQFQRYGASFLDSLKYDFTYTPKPNFGSKYPKEEGKRAYGKDLSQTPKMNEISLAWIQDAYENSTKRDAFFKTAGFTRHAGTTKLQQQLEEGLSEAAIKASWQEDINAFKVIRAKYLLYD
ncbi:exo-beta-N-acetylmuramidase NamZ family protein [Spongiimicrobium salis]|uniref:exo-beta-N-acetylmuramidase NamZ family protein n=1 Tax=Spongiimicrobium salis TaxID=1667022 RepID=UPI00374D1C0C